MDLGTISVVDLTPSVLVGIFVLLVFTGRMIPLKVHDARVKDITADRDGWKATAQRYEEQNTALIMGSSKVAFGVLEALPRPKDMK